MWRCCNGCTSRGLLCVSPVASTMAARTRKLAVLQRLHQKGASRTAGICTLAACGGRLAVLQWARQQGCTWGEDTNRPRGVGRHRGGAQTGVRERLPVERGCRVWSAGARELRRPAVPLPKRLPRQLGMRRGVGPCRGRQRPRLTAQRLGGRQRRSGRRAPGGGAGQPRPRPASCNPVAATLNTQGACKRGVRPTARGRLANRRGRR
jgi:hypothetical protein